MYKLIAKKRTVQPSKSSHYAPLKGGLHLCRST